MAGERLQGIILAGGKGERFWPVSREQRPKQLLRLFGQESLLQATWRRLRLRLAPDALRVLTGADLAAAVRAELPELAGEHLVLESIGRNTAPALAAAAALGVRDGSDPLQLVVPSDHWIPDAAAFWACVDHAVTAAAGPERPLVTRHGLRLYRARRAARAGGAHLGSAPLPREARPQHR
jgi:mannose-1-phosphate guanylyltransferase